MSIKIIEQESNFIYAPEKTEITERWGVYSIPRMWRAPSGELVVRFNGEQDCSDTNSMFAAPNLYFISTDNGENWQEVPNGEEIYDISILQGITPPCIRLENGNQVAFRDIDGILPITGMSSEKRFKVANQDAIVTAYPYGEIPDDCKGLERVEFNKEGKVIAVTPVVFDFPEREVLINIAALSGDGYVPVEQHIKPFIFKSPYFSSVRILPDGTWVALSYGQNPDVSDRFCQEIYMIASTDCGVTWKKRSTVASDIENLPYGYGGDGNEVSLTRTTNGTLLCAMRMEMSIDPNIATPICDTMISVSYDDGYTWEKPFSVADSSVTPQVIALDNHVLILVYGRPGVHYKISSDDGKTWSEAHSIIGKTLEEEREAGRTDAESKYYDTCSYSNCFVEQIDNESVLVLYNAMKYPADTTRHKAAYVKKITVKNEQ